MREMAVRLLSVVLVLLLGAHHPLMGGMPAMAASDVPTAAMTMPATEHAVHFATVAGACQVAADTACPLMVAAAPQRAAPTMPLPPLAVGSPAEMGMHRPRMAPAYAVPRPRAATALQRQVLLGILRR